MRFSKYIYAVKTRYFCCQAGVLNFKILLALNFKILLKIRIFQKTFFLMIFNENIYINAFYTVSVAL